MLTVREIGHCLHVSRKRLRTTTDVGISTGGGRPFRAPPVRIFSVLYPWFFIPVRYIILRPLSVVAMSSDRESSLPTGGDGVPPGISNETEAGGAILKAPLRRKNGSCHTGQRGNLRSSPPLSMEGTDRAAPIPPLISGAIPTGRRETGFGSGFASVPRGELFAADADSGTQSPTHTFGSIQVVRISLGGIPAFGISPEAVGTTISMLQYRSTRTTGRVDLESVSFESVFAALKAPP